MEPSRHDCTQLNPQQRWCELYIPALLTGVTYCLKKKPSEVERCSGRGSWDLLDARSDTKVLWLWIVTSDLCTSHFCFICLFCTCNYIKLGDYLDHVWRSVSKIILISTDARWVVKGYSGWWTHCSYFMVHLKHELRQRCPKTSPKGGIALTKAGSWLKYNLVCFCTNMYQVTITVKVLLKQLCIPVFRGCGAATFTCSLITRTDAIVTPPQRL